MVKKAASFEKIAKKVEVLRKALIMVYWKHVLNNLCQIFHVQGGKK